MDARRVRTRLEVGECGVRIVAGQCRGRRLSTPRGATTRPTSDRVREALFAALDAAPEVAYHHARVLDLFAGSGALSLEALSRGAAHAVLVERDNAALSVIAANVATLGCGDAVTVVAGDALRGGAARAARLGPYALLLLDPPYRIEPALVGSAVSSLMSAGALTPGAVIAWEHAAKTEVPLVAGAHVMRTYTYGDTAVTLVAVDEGDGDA
jgi:16S rRNA (guanine966-N2)-methyltransferase